MTVIIYDSDVILESAHRRLHLDKTHLHEIQVSVRIRCLKYAYAS